MLSDDGAGKEHVSKMKKEKNHCIQTENTTISKTFAENIRIHKTFADNITISKTCKFRISASSRH